jgi:hypothetical protein
MRLPDPLLLESPSGISFWNLLLFMDGSITGCSEKLEEILWS